jgi:predicted secreted Zn-dependent protease
MKQEWQRFLTALAGHEAGHHTISKQHAKTMLSLLQGMKASDCSQLKLNVQKRMQTELSVLANDQARYDANTDHGATQGASLHS